MTTTVIVIYLKFSANFLILYIHWKIKTSLKNNNYCWQVHVYLRCRLSSPHYWSVLEYLRACLHEGGGPQVDFSLCVNNFFRIYWRLVFGCFEFLKTCILLRQSGLQSIQTAGHRILWGGLWIWFTNKSHLDSLWIYFIYTCME